MKETLLNFLKTGSFNSFPFGSNRESVVEQLGSTNNIIPRSRKDPRPAILKYDRVEFYINELDQLHGIMVQFGFEPSPSALLTVDYTGITVNTTEQEILNLLYDLKLNYSIESHVDSIHVITETGVTIFIDQTVVKIGKFVS